MVVTTCSTSASRLSCSGDRCRITTYAAPLFSGTCWKNSRNALMPPAEAPSPTIRKSSVAIGSRRRPSGRGRRVQRSIRAVVRGGLRTGETTMPTAQKTRIFLADDHETVREGLKLLLNAQSDMEVVGEAERWRRGGEPGRPTQARHHCARCVDARDERLEGRGGAPPVVAGRQGADPHPPFRRWLPAPAAARGRGGLRAQAEPSGRAAARDPLGGRQVAGISTPRSPER